MTAPNSAGLAVDQESISFVNTQAKEADFQAKCKGVVLTSTADVHIQFDGVANTDSFLLKATTDTPLYFPVEFTRLSALGSSGSGTLYIMGLR